MLASSIAAVVKTASKRADPVQIRSRPGWANASLRQRSKVDAPTPISLATSLIDALSGGSSLATALSLNSCPYRANSCSSQRPRVYQIYRSDNHSDTGGGRLRQRLTTGAPLHQMRDTKATAQTGERRGPGKSPALDRIGRLRCVAPVGRIINMDWPLRRSARPAIRIRNALAPNGRQPTAATLHRPDGGHRSDCARRASAADADPADGRLQERGGAGQAPCSSWCTVATWCWALRRPRAARRRTQGVLAGVPQQECGGVVGAPARGL